MSTTNKARAAAPATGGTDHEPERDDDMPPSSTHATLAEALLEAQRLIAHGVRKTGKAEVETRSGGKYEYKFAKGEDMIAGCREVLLAVGLLWTLESYDVVDEQGSSLPIFDPVFALEHPASGATLENERIMQRLEALPESDPRRKLLEQLNYPPPRRFKFPIPISMAGAADKALAGARTYASSYALRDVLLVPRPDENEPDKRKSDDGVGSWRARRDGASDASNRDQKPAASRKPSPAEIAYQAMNEAWRDYVQAARARGIEPVFAEIYRRAIGKTWPGSASKADGGDMAKAAAEIKRMITLLDEIDHDDKRSVPDGVDENTGELFGDGGAA